VLDISYPPNSPLWEFKHRNGKFKRGDLIGLREIGRRASRHALIHRHSTLTNPKSTVSAVRKVEAPEDSIRHTLKSYPNVLEEKQVGHLGRQRHDIMAPAADAPIKQEKLDDVSIMVRASTWKDDCMRYLTSTEHPLRFVSIVYGT
jgi:hypothetical protein